MNRIPFTICSECGQPLATCDAIGACSRGEPALKLAVDPQPPKIIPFEDPVITREQALSAAAQLLGVAQDCISIRENPVGCWMEINPEGDKSVRFRAKTWFGVLEKIHAMLVQAVIDNPIESREAAEK